MSIYYATGKLGFKHAVEIDNSVLCHALSLTKEQKRKLSTINQGVEQLLKNAKAGKRVANLKEPLDPNKDPIRNMSVNQYEHYRDLFLNAIPNAESLSSSEITELRRLYPIAMQMYDFLKELGFQHAVETDDSSLYHATRILGGNSVYGSYAELRTYDDKLADLRRQAGSTDVMIPLNILRSIKSAIDQIETLINSTKSLNDKMKDIDDELKTSKDYRTVTRLQNTKYGYQETYKRQIKRMDQLFSDAQKLYDENAIPKSAVKTFRK